jgi:hypothetical protein
MFVFIDQAVRRILSARKLAHMDVLLLAANVALTEFFVFPYATAMILFSVIY